VTLPQWSYTVFADPDEHDLELVAVNRQTDETVDEGFVTAEQVFSNLAARAA
jgi:hypothetical protein